MNNDKVPSMKDNVVTKNNDVAIRISANNGFVIITPLDDLSGFQDGQRVRIVGRLQFYSPKKQHMKLRLRRKTTLVDVSLLGPIPIVKNHIWTIIGYLRNDDNGCTLVEALCGKVTNYMNIPLFLRSLQTLRAHLDTT
eukprot:m.108437 g.108437  ORF g.108437 m.108437 type:complete len:138 (+) comp9189_c0_seq12:482-895(+)